MISEKFKSIVKSAVEGYRDPWADKHLEKLPAEKVIRHRYIPSKRIWVTDISLIKMEAVPFDRGAQRQIYRLKKISQAPTVNWRKIDWARAPNYVAKCYLTEDGTIGTDDKIRCFNDVRLQYEAAHWANIFNKASPPKAIHVIQCYVLELNSRPGSPVVGCERFVDGHDKYVAGFVKHNSNSGFVDNEENRCTPQAFSAHSFYASAGKLMVVDVQGVGDLYTDPQIHTQDGRFGNSDLGIRGMALFFVSFRRNFVCDFLKLPRFPLSAKERNRMLAPVKPLPVIKGLLNGCTGSRKDFQRQDSSEQRFVGKANDTVTRAEALEFERKLLSNPSFVTLSPSEQRGCLPAVLPSEDQKEIERALSRAITAAFRVIRTVHKTGSHRLDEAEVRKIAQDPLELLELFDFSDGVLIDEEIIFTTMDPNAINLHFHSEEGHLPLHPRRPSEDMTTSSSASSSASSPLPESYLTSKVGSVSSSEAVLDEQEILRLNHEKLLLLQKNAGEVHLELATLEAAGRFTMVGPKPGTQSKAIESSIGDSIADISSCVFHLAEAVVLGSCAATLALGRLRFGLSTDVLMTLSDYIPRDQASALALLMLAAFRGSANGAYLAAQLCDNAGEIERAISMYQLCLHHLRETSSKASSRPQEDSSGDHQNDTCPSTDKKMTPGGEVEVNYLGCGSWYPAVYVQAVDEVTSKIRYVDGDQEDEVQNDWIRSPVAAETGTGAEAGTSLEDIQLQSLMLSEEDTVSVSAAATESKNIEPQKRLDEGAVGEILASTSPQTDNLSLYTSVMTNTNGEMSLASTVTSIGAIGSSDADIEYEHKRGIGSDDSCSLASYEVLYALGRLHGILAKRYHEQESVSKRLAELTVHYYTEASTEAFDSGKTAFAMKCVEDVAEYES